MQSPFNLAKDYSLSPPSPCSLFAFFHQVLTSPCSFSTPEQPPLLEQALLDDLLSLYRSTLLKPIELQEASVIADLRFDTLAFNHVEAVKYPFEQLTRAQECIAEISFIKTSKTVDQMAATKVKKNLLSCSGDLLIVMDQMAQYLFFKDSLPTIPETTLEQMAESSPALKDYLDQREGHLNQRAQQRDS